MIETSYNELNKPINAPIGSGFFPDSCPCCGSSSETGETPSQYAGPLYSCGGQYRIKAQCQNHTDKYWGFCPANKLKKLKATGLLESEAVVWAVQENGNRIHVASFSHSTQAQSFAVAFSNDYPRFWDYNSKVAYIEVLGCLGFGVDGMRFSRGELIAEKSLPTHIRPRISGRERRWHKVTQISIGHHKKGELVGE